VVEQTSTNIIYLNREQQPRFTADDRSIPADSPSAPHPSPSQDQAFQAIILKNRQNYDRLQKDRLKSNKAILKSYRLK
jgi:hypothetical protein